MRKFNRIAATVVSAIALMGATTQVAQAATADNGDGEFHFTLKTHSYDYAAAKFSIENSNVVKVNGADQVSWEAETSTATISPRAIQRAPRLHTTCTSSNRTTQSQQIWRASHHHTVVVVMPGSCLWNRGKHDHIMMGFPWKVTTPAVLVGDSHHRYRHGFSLVLHQSQVQPGEKVVGKVKLLGKTWLIVRKCRNFIGGPVDVYVPSAVQVHYASDIKRHGDAVATTDTTVHATFGVTCPNGAYFNVDATGHAAGTASAAIDYTDRTRISVLNAHSVSLTSDSHADGEVKSVSDAQLSIEVSGSCGTSTPPTNPPAASASADVCTTAGGTAPNTIQVSGKNNDDVTRDLVYSLSGPTTTQPVTKSVGSGQTATVPFSGLALGNYTYTVTVTDTGKSDSGSVSLQPCPAPTMTLSLDRPNDVDQSVATPGQPIDWSFTEDDGHAVAPTGAGNVTYSVSSDVGTVKFITANSPCATNGLNSNVVKTMTKPSGTYDLPLCYIASTEDAASYGGSDTITLTAVFAGKTYTVSKTITVNPTPTIPG